MSREGGPEFAPNRTAPRLAPQPAPRSARSRAGRGRAWSDAGRGYALVLLGASLFIVNAGVSRLTLDSGIAPTRLATARSTGTVLLLLVLVVASGRWRGLALRRSEIPLVLGYGVLGVAGVQWGYFVAIDRLPIGIALLLEYLAPLLIALWARFVQRERVNRLLWPALGLCLAGLALVAEVTGGGDGLDPLGVAAALFAAVAFSAYFLLGQRLVAERDVLTTAFWGFLVATIVLTTVSPVWAFPVPLTNEVALPTALGSASVVLLVLLGWVVLPGTLLPFACTTAALRYLPATSVSLLATLEPVGAAGLAWWWFGEYLTPVQIAGAGLVLFGIVLAVLARPKPQSRATELPEQATW